MKYVHSLMLMTLLLGGCRLVSQQELADLKNPPNPHMGDISATWQQKIVPQYQSQARPLAELKQSLSSSKDFDSACQQFGYRAATENPCVFTVKISGTVESVNTTSRNGKMQVKDVSGDTVTVQVGPIIRGTLLRDGYRGVSYQDFNDQVLFGDFGRGINEQAIAMMKTFQPKVGDNVTLEGVFSSWDIPSTVPDITPAHIVRQ
ncbi:hypothetical protein CIG19_01385 [Enterobacterales bacterium CwR94]|nr:hypothetical protein CIG19_01385 [Enterobacterales bacterium CwR94]